MSPNFFAGPDEFRAWLAEHHDDAAELLVGFHKKGSGRQSMTWPEAVDEALCFGWIDGVTRSLDGDSYMIRFTPRKPGSTWSNRNVARVEALIAAGRMQPAGLAAFERRSEDNTGVYSFERESPAELDPACDARLRTNAKAWEYFQSRPPWYRRAAIHWVMQAKREETRERRLGELIEDSAAGRTIRRLTRP